MASSIIHYATKAHAQLAVKAVLRTIIPDDGVLYMLPKHHQCHIVILASEKENGQEDSYPKWLDRTIGASVLYEYSVGFKKDWLQNYESIARHEALGLWVAESPEKAELVTGLETHLRFPGRELYWGGADHNQLIIVCAGLQPVNSMIAGMISSIIIGLANDAFTRAKC